MIPSWMCKKNCLGKYKLHSPPPGLWAGAWRHNVCAQSLTLWSPLRSLQSWQYYHPLLFQKTLSFLARSLCTGGVHVILTSILHKLHNSWGKGQSPVCFGRVPSKLCHTDLEVRLSHAQQVLGHHCCVGSRGRRCVTWTHIQGFLFYGSLKNRCIGEAAFSLPFPWLWDSCPWGFGVSLSGESLEDVPGLSPLSFMSDPGPVCSHLVGSPGHVPP